MQGRGYRAIAGAAIILVAIMSAAPAAAQSTPEWKCNAQGAIPSDERIAACTSVLESEKYGRQGAIRAYLGCAAAYSDKGDFERAIADYTTFIQLYPKNMFAYYCRGAAYHNMHDCDRAIADYTETILLNPQHLHAYRDRGAAYSQSGYHDHAIADYDRAIQLSPADARIYVGRGMAYYRKGDLDRAFSDSEQALRLDPKQDSAFGLRATVYKTKGEVDRAVADYDRLIELDPKNPRAYRSRAIAHVQAGSISKSLADLDRSIELDPRDAYSALWHEVVAKRSNVSSRLAAVAGELDLSKWPAPIIHLFLGEMSPEAVLAAAGDANGEKKREQICEANFYLGELALLRGAREEARPLLLLATAECPKGFVERQAADAELRAIGTAP